MIKVLGLILVAVALTLAGCAFVPDVTYNEASDGTNDVTEELAGSIATGTLSIKGTISSATDSDNYRVDVGTRTAITYDTLYNGKSQRAALGISFYPFSFTTYDASDAVLMNYLFMAGVSSEDLDPGTAYIIFHFYGTSDYASGNYELQLQ